MINGINGKTLAWVRTGVLLINIFLLPVGIYIITQLDTIKSDSGQLAQRVTAIEADRWTGRDASRLVHDITEEHQDIWQAIFEQCRGGR